jgi:hypothetical protein
MEIATQTVALERSSLMALQIITIAPTKVIITVGSRGGLTAAFGTSLLMLIFANRSQ